MRWFKGAPPEKMYTSYLIKYSEDSGRTYEYYVVEYNFNGKLIESLGERYYWFDSKDVVAYTTFDELNKDSGAYLIF